MARRFQLEGTHAPRIPWILDIDDVVLPTVVNRVHVVVVDEDVVHATREILIKRREDLHVSRIGAV